MVWRRKLQHRRLDVHDKGCPPIADFSGGGERRVADALIDAGTEFAHGFTYSGHPAAAAVALQTVRAMRAEGVIERVATGMALQSQIT